MKNVRFFKKFAYAFLAFALLAYAIVPVQVYASQLPTQEQQEERSPRFALGRINFSGSSKTTVKVHGYGLDTGDVSTVSGSVIITVGSKSKAYSFTGTIPGLYNKDFGSWYLPGWTSAQLSYYYFTFTDGSKSNRIYPGISIKNNF